MTYLIAVMGKMPNVWQTAGSARHLSRNGTSTLCGLLVRNRINHANALRHVVSCRKCTRRADREEPAWRAA